MSGKRVNIYDKKKIIILQKQKSKTDVYKILVSKEEPYGTKNSFRYYSFRYFIGYNENDVIRPLCKKLPHMTGYAKNLNLI